MNSDPLDKIFDSVEELDNEKKEILVDILSPIIVVDPEKGIIHTKKAWNNINAKQKILAYLLAKLALSTRNQKFVNSATPNEIETKTELPGGTVRPKLRELIHDRIAFQNEDGSYSIRPTSMSINNARALFEDVIEKNKINME